VLADSLARAGVGFLRIVDRDFVELSNLQRQVLFDEDDVANRVPKAIAAAEKLARINSGIELDPIVADIDHTNILKYFEGIDLVVDGTDNFEVRFLVNDAALETSTPWVYGGCVGSHGQTMAIFPGESACLRCLIEDVPPPGSAETCDTAGVLGAAINVVASLQSVAALKILIGRGEEEVHAMALGDAADWDADIEPLAARAMPWFSARHARHAEDAKPEEVEREFSPTTWTTAEISDGLELRQRGHDPRNLKRLMTLARHLRSWLEEERRAT